MYIHPSEKEEKKCNKFLCDFYINSTIFNFLVQVIYNDKLKYFSKELSSDCTVPQHLPILFSSVSTVLLPLHTGNRTAVSEEKSISRNLMYGHLQKYR